MTAATLDRIAQAEQLASWATLVGVPKGTKGPRATGWNSDPAQWITSPSAAREYLTAHPGAGVGLLHSESQTAALDLDHDGAALAFKAVGIDLGELMASNPYKVRGRRGEKPLYRVPHGLSLKNVSLAWPDPSGKKGPGGRVKGVTIFELRGGPVQDVMPPSIHPDTGKPYTWVGPVPDSLADLPEPPPELLRLWEHWQALEPVMRAACPWAPLDLDEVTAPSERDLKRLGGGSAEGGSVIDQFNGAYSLAEVLGEAGYKGPQRGPWLYPGSSSGQAGVRLRRERTPRGAEVVMSWHTADPLGDRLPRDAFAVWALLEHEVDLYTATPEQRREVVKKAARRLGLPEPQRGSAEGTQAPSTPRPAADLPPVNWGEVTPLPALTEPVPPLPVELLPAPLSEWIQAEARAAGLPLEMLAGPVLVGAGGMLSATVNLRNTLNAPALPANLWGAVCGPPSIRKTHAVTVGAAPLNHAQRVEFERLDAERAGLETDRVKAAAQLDALENQLKRALKGGPKPPEMPSDDELTQAREALSAAEQALKPLRYVVNDPTVEKLGEIMRDNPQGVTVVRDELSGWLAGFEKAGREQERAFYLEAANGTGSYTFDRLTRGTVHIPLMCAGVLGSIQPGPLAEVLDAQHGAGDGLLQRFQVLIWPDTLPAFNQAAQREQVSPDLREAAAALLSDLGTLTPEGLGSTYPSGSPAPLRYTPEAQAVYDAWEVEHAAQVRDLSKGEAYRAHLGKQPGTFARLALIFHALDVAALGVAAHPHPAQVGEESAALAWAWCDYLTTHAKKLWREGRRRDVLDARTVLRAIERGRVLDGQKIADARRVLAELREGMNGPRLDAALKVLTDCGAVRVEVSTPSGGKSGGRPVKTLRVHPDALTALDGAEDEVSA
ncbi:DUF3987 domain-containing protein [Deinococcus fonticola]|uniref:DUF3987 domain-containing protein n=1 Tax=Deinococcus fonticola TaxID=2528713 RepID=UPI001075838F|nr:DUF3987 domain-containing protein [Deinococcus fonticola]